MKKSKTEIKIIDFPEGEPPPALVRGDSVDKVILGMCPKTMANWRGKRIGPEFFMCGNKPYYKFDTLISFFTQHPVKTSGDLIKRKEGEGQNGTSKIRREPKGKGKAPLERGQTS